MKLFQNRIQIFCAFCRSPRKVYASRRIRFRHVIGSALAAGLLMTFFWQDFDARVVVVFVILLALSETFVQLRWRMSLVCQHCGFDPVIYKRNPEIAAEKVKNHLERRKNDPRYLLARPLDLPKRKPTAAEKSLVTSPGALPEAPSEESSTGRLVSRQI